MRFHLGLVGLLVAGCTNTINGMPGGDDDDGSGNPPPPPPPTSVTIVVQDGAAVQPGVRVIFQNADDSVIAQAMTDATGSANADMPDGGNLTVIRTYPSATPARPSEVYTYVGVVAGDHLVLGHAMDTSDTPSAINILVPTAAQGTVSVVSSCGSGQGPQPTVAMTTIGCPANVMFYVSDQADGSFIASAPYSTNVDLSEGVLSENLSSTLAATNVSPTITSIDVAVAIMNGTYQLFSTTPKRVDTASTQTNLPDVTGVDKLVIATITETKSAEVVTSREVWTPGPAIIDATVGLIPSITAAPTFSPTTVTWIEGGTGTADFVFAALDVKRGAQTPSPPEAEYLRTVVAAHTGASLTLPLLTGDDAIYNPATADTITGKHGLVQLTGGYDAARPAVFSVANFTDITPANGALTLSYYGTLPTP